MGATALLRGTNRESRLAAARPGELTLLREGQSGPVEEFAFPDSSVESDLSPLEPFSKTLSTLDSSSIPCPLRRSDGISSPSCFVLSEPELPPIQLGQRNSMAP